MRDCVREKPAVFAKRNKSCKLMLIESMQREQYLESKEKEREVYQGLNSCLKFSH